jgi:hypothetical protein
MDSRLQLLAPTKHEDDDFPQGLPSREQGVSHEDLHLDVKGKR